ncbi:glycosyltransferase family 4 protein [Flavobacterium sp.]|uniref:glycosyltransferase family 4 protein n=1 Tax=Flavobacterium sp. TaxID=239 RepID=UPI003D6A70B3
MEKIIIHHRSSHHAHNSGYGRLIDYMEAETIPSGKSGLPYKIAKYISQKADQESGLYDSTGVIKDWELFRSLLFSRNQDRTIHYLNGERDIRYAIKMASLFSKTRVCATFHKPPEILSSTILNTQYLKKMDGAIAVGINQVDFLKNWLNTDNVQYIPHGVDVNFFKPDYSKTQENNIIFAGQHLRDFEALNYVIPRIKEQIPTIKIKVVLRKDFAKNIISDASVEMFSGIDDNELRNLYQEASLLFLPLKNVTACNTILEAMACGLPIVSTDIEGNRGYVKNEAGILVSPTDYKTYVDVVVDVLKNKEKRDYLALKSRENALKLDWEVIAGQVNGFYDSMVR